MKNFYLELIRTGYYFWQQILYTCSVIILIMSSLLKYLQCKDELPHPKGSLSLSIPFQMIASANKEVEKVLTKSVSKKHGPYRK